MPANDGKIYGRSKFEQWAANRPDELQDALAVRAVLRALPITSTAICAASGPGRTQAKEIRARVLLPILQPLLVVDVASRWPQKSELFKKYRGTKSSDTAAQISDSGLRGDQGLRELSLFANASAFVAAGGRHFSPRAIADACSATKEKMAWSCIDQEISDLQRHSNFAVLASWPLWLEHPVPARLEELWIALKGHLISESAEEHWEPWIDWYERLLFGRHQHEELETRKALLDSEFWGAGPSVLNAKIKEIETDFFREHPAGQEAATPLGVALVYKEQTGQVGYLVGSISREEAYENLIQKIADRVDRCWQGHNRLADALKDEVDEILTDIGRALERYRDKPWRLHDDFATAVVNLSGLDGAEQELRIRNLLRDLQDGVSDLRELVPELRDKTKARMAARIGLPDNDVLAAFEALIDALGDAGEADLVQELRDHLETLKTARAENPDDDGAPMDEGEVKDAAYSEGGLWIRVRNRANEVATSVGKGADGAVKTTEKTAKILDAAQKIGKHWQKVEPWIISWF